MHDKIKSLLSALGFTSKKETPEIFSKVFGSLDKPIIIDFNKEEIIYPESTAEGTNQPNGMLVHERTTCNFSAPENFVVLECVCRLLEKGYRPEHIEIEKPWSLGHTAVGGRADIVVSDEKREKTLLIIECKRFGTEYNKALSQLRTDGGQLFSYWQQERATKWLCLYASQLNSDGKIEYKQTIISTSDDANVAGLAEKDKTILLYKKASTVPELFSVWDETYHKAEVQSDILFGSDTTAYQIGIAPLRKRDLVNFSPDDQIVNKFEEILRHNNVSDKENAFNRLIALFICKLVGEQKAWKEWTKPEYFAQFKKEFEESTQIKNRRKSNAFKKLSQSEQEKELNRRFYDFVKNVEREKLKIFSLVYDQSTLIINAPSDNAKQKAFLGYEWSDRKGNEGLHMIKEGGELYNPHDFDDPASLNTAIRKTFGNDCTNPPGDYSQIAFLKNLIDFTRTDFNHAIKMTVDKKKVEITSIYPMVKLGDVSEIKKGKSITFADAKEGKIKVISGGKDFAFYHNEANRSAGIITVSASGASAGFVNYWDEPIFASDCCTIYGKTKEETLFIFNILKSIQEDIYHLQRGSAQPHVYASDLESISIPLPPLEVQREIVKDCQAIDNEVSAAQKAIEVAAAKITTIISEVKGEMKQICDFCKIASGGTPSRKKKEYWAGGEIPWIKTQELEDSILVKTDECITELGLKESSARFYDEGSIVVAMYGATIGQTAKLGIKATTNQACAVLHKFDSEVLNDYVWKQLIKNKTALKNIGHGSGQPNLNAKDVALFKIPVPSLAEQKRVVAAVEKLEGEIASARAIIAAAPNRKSKILKDRL